MDRRRLFEFLLLKPAFSSRNISSIALVVLFFLIYMFSGGKVSWVPAVKHVRTNSFGAGTGPAQTRSDRVEEFSGDIVDEEEDARAALRGNPAGARSSGARGAAASEEARTAPAQREEAPASSSEGDSKLSAIRERLKNLGSK